jgi:hypothetical protein
LVSGGFKVVARRRGYLIPLIVRRTCPASIGSIPKNFNFWTDVSLVWPNIPLSFSNRLRNRGEHRTMKFKTAVIIAVACLTLALPSAALAISPTQDAYGGVAGQQDHGGNSGDNGNKPAQESNSPESEVLGATAESAPVAAVETVATPESSSSLPFTGLEVGIIALVGVFLIGGGAVLYRVTRQNHRFQG